MRLSRQPRLGMRIVNPLGVSLSRNATAQASTVHDTAAVRFTNERDDKLVFGGNHYANLDLKPQFVQYLEGFKFVYLNPPKTYAHHTFSASA
ncbi:MAG: hypothetical protein SVO26_03520 [Chloroflexota bacterium]|nr:hypothetical protein [Chloroflexota bacterium]